MTKEKNMKKNLIFTTALALAVGLGVAAGAHQAAFVEANAVDDNTVIYLDCSACNWFSDDAKVGLWNHGGDVFDEFTFDSTTNLYKTTVTPSCTSFNLFRGSALNWENIWNQSDDASFEAGKDLIVADDYVDNKMMFHWSKYEEPADCMFAIVIDFGTLTEYADFHNPEVHCYDAAYDTFSKYAPLHQLAGTVYTVNMTYNHNVGVNTIEFLFKTTDNADVFSETLAINPNNDSAWVFNFNGEWSDKDINKWDIVRKNFGTPRIRGGGISPDQDFSVDVSREMFYATVTVTDSTSSTQIYFGDWNYGAVRAASVAKYCTDYSLNSFKLEEGTYDIFGYNSYEDGGIFEIKKHGELVDGSIYYVTESGEATNDYIYSWGGIEQFGPFPGTKITDVTDVEEITGNGIVHFQGGDAKLIYEIPVKMNYPLGDEMFLFNNGTDEYKSDERELVNESAYWWTGAANNDAHEAMEFITIVETFRNSATDYSICNIAKSNAQTLVNVYNSFSKDVQETYIDCSTVYTWADETKTSETMITYKAIMERLALIAGVELSNTGSGRQVIDNAQNIEASSLIAVVGIIAIISISSIAVLLVVKKIKNN